jgi:hypothetical protein
METTTPNNIHRIENAIKECELKIENLTNQLKEAQEERRRWERELAFTRGLDHFNKCPVEILMEIFQLYLAPKHHTISSLLLVCKRWYELIMKTPPLWSRIELDFSLTPFNRPLRFIPYVQACKQRSRNLKLDITLDLQNICSAESYHKTLIPRFIKGECGDCLGRIVSRFLDSWNDVYDFYCPEFERHIEEVVNTVHVLVGDDSKDMARWSSLRITLPEDDEPIKAIVPTCSLLNGPATSLKEFTIDGLDYVSDYDEFEPFPGLIDCSQVERLTVYGIEFESIPVQWSSIKHLDITVDRQNDLLIISNMISLETLRIRISTPYYLFGQRAVDSCFTHLRSLVVAGYIPNYWFDTFKFDAPALRNFSVLLSDTRRYISESFDVKFPRISPRAVTFRNDDDSRDFGTNNIEKAVRRVLQHFSSAEEIVFGNFTDETISIALSERIKDGQQCPVSVYTERKGDFFRLHHAERI